MIVACVDPECAWQGDCFEAGLDFDKDGADRLRCPRCGGSTYKRRKDFSKIRDQVEALAPVPDPTSGDKEDHA